MSEIINRMMRLNNREKVMLNSAIIVVLLWVLINLYQGIFEQQRLLSSKIQLAIWLDKADEVLTQTSKTIPHHLPVPIVTLVEQAMPSLPVSRDKIILKVTDSGAVKLSISSISMAILDDWLMKLCNHKPIVIESASFKKLEEPGMVQASIELIYS